MCALPSDHVSEALDYLGCRADVLSLDPYSLDEVLATFSAEPEIVLVTPCDFHLDEAAAQAAGVPARFPMAQVWAIDGDGLVVRPGPRLIDGVEAVAAVLHPDAVPAPTPGAITRIV